MYEFDLLKISIYEITRIYYSYRLNRVLLQRVNAIIDAVLRCNKLKQSRFSSSLQS